MGNLSANAYVVRFRSKDYFTRHGYDKGLKILEDYPGINDQYVIVDGYDLHGFGLVIDGVIVCDVMDYMVDMKTKISIEEAKVTMSSLFI